MRALRSRNSWTKDSSVSRLSLRRCCSRCSSSSSSRVNNLLASSTSSSSSTAGASSRIFNNLQANNFIAASSSMPKVCWVKVVSASASVGLSIMATPKYAAIILRSETPRSHQACFAATRSNASLSEPTLTARAACRHFARALGEFASNHADDRHSKQMACTFLQDKIGSTVGMVEAVDQSMYIMFA